MSRAEVQLSGYSLNIFVKWGYVEINRRYSSTPDAEGEVFFFYNLQQIESSESFETSLSIFNFKDGTVYHRGEQAVFLF